MQNGEGTWDYQSGSCFLDGGVLVDRNSKRDAISGTRLTGVSEHVVKCGVARDTLQLTLFELFKFIQVD
jgi:hypothetical protein